MRLVVLYLVTVSVGAELARNTSAGKVRDDECIFDAIGALLTLGQCLSCAKQCDKDVADSLTKLAHGDLDPAAWLQDTNKCTQCIDTCKPLEQPFVTAMCLLGKAACHTDFCATCCGDIEGTKGICVGNDFNIRCAPQNRDCTCGKNSGNTNSCCTGCPGDPTGCGSGHGMNTGDFCGNDFHSEACFGEKPVCCTNCCGKPACCAKGQTCHSPALGDSSCVDDLGITV